MTAAPSSPRFISCKERFGDERRTALVPWEEEIDYEDLIEQHTCVISLTHEGYIKRQLAEAARMAKLAEKKLPKDLDYASLEGLRLEARQKLNKIKLPKEKK